MNIPYLRLLLHSCDIRRSRGWRPSPKLPRTRHSNQVICRPHFSLHRLSLSGYLNCSDWDHDVQKSFLVLDILLLGPKDQVISSQSWLAFWTPLFLSCLIVMVFYSELTFTLPEANYFGLCRWLNRTPSRSMNSLRLLIMRNLNRSLKK